MRAHAGSSTRSSTLPVILTAMLGRDQETSMLRAMLRDPDVRMVTITGPGGVGKTRLAVGVAADADDDLEVVFVPLAAIRETGRVVPAIGQAIGINLEPGEGSDGALASALAGRNVLLVLDNLEQLPGIASLLDRLIADAPTLTLLATSQVVLEVSGEHVFHLAPLPVPDADESDVAGSEAVALFMQRAREVDRALTLDHDNSPVIAEICRRLDGLPLAIELAAARANLLSPAELLSRLGDRLGVLSMHRGEVDARHRTLRDAIGWTYDLLDPVEQALFRQVSVFTGGFSLAAARDVFTPPDGRDIADVLDVLVRHNLLDLSRSIGGAMRYQMLESLRAFGVDRLERLGEDGVARRKHAEWVARLAEEAESHLVGPEQSVWLSRLDEDRANLHAAVEWSLGQGLEEFVLRICGAIWQYFPARGLITEARTWLRRALLAKAAHDPHARMKALNAAGHLAHDQRALEASGALFEQARQLAIAGGDVEQEVTAIYGLGLVAQGTTRFSESHALYDEGIRRAREAGYQRLMVVGESNQGQAFYYQGKIDDAIQHWANAATGMEDLDDIGSVAVMLSNIGGACLLIGDMARAQESIMRALEIQRALGARKRIVSTLNNLGLVALQMKDFSRARDVLTEAMAMHREDRNISGQSHVAHSLANVDLDEGNIREAAFWFLESLRLVTNTDDTSGIIHFVQLLASICSAHGSHRNVVVLIAAESRLRDEFHYEWTPEDRTHMDRAMSVARTALTGTSFAEAWAEGTSLDLTGLLQRMPIIARQIVGRQVTGPEAVFPNGPDQDTRSMTDYGLTGREMDVLRLLGEGRSTAEISAALGIRSRTVGTHIANLIAKMEVASRTAAVARGVRDGVIRPGVSEDEMNAPR